VKTPLDLIAEILARALLAMFGVVVLMFSLIFLAAKKAAHEAREKARSDTLRQKARDLGLDFAPKRDVALARKYQFLDHFEKVPGGSGRSCINVITGVFETYPVTLFDYHYVTRENYTWWWAPSWETHRYLSLSIVNMDSNFPQLTIAEEGFFSKIAQAIGFDDIDFESHEFSRRYKVKSQSKKFAYDFCNARMMDYLLDQPIMPIEVENHALALGFDDSHEAGVLVSRLRHVVKLRSLIPDYVFDEVFDVLEHVDQQSNDRSAKDIDQQSNSQNATTEGSRVYQENASHRRDRQVTNRSAKGIESKPMTPLRIVKIGAIFFILTYVLIFISINGYVIYSSISGMR
jgi:hypothetical protein